jgi:hypothetical protein
MSGPAADAAAPATSASEQLRRLAGRWQGSLTEVGGWYLQGDAPLDLTLKPDGTWSGTIGGAAAEGRTSMKGRQLLLTGTARSRGTMGYPVYLRLQGDERRRWGQTLGRFGERQERAMIALERVS